MSTIEFIATWLVVHRLVIINIQPSTKNNKIAVKK